MNLAMLLGMSTDWYNKVGKVIAVTAEATAGVVRDTAVSTAGAVRTTADAVRTTAGVGVGSIALEVTQIDYEPGDKILGRVFLKLAEDTAADKLVVRLYATGTRTRYQRSGTSKTKSLVHEKETLYTFDLEVDGDKVYRAGESQYYFAVRIPTDADNDDSVVGGVLGDVAKVASLFSRGAKHPTTWALRAFLHIPWKRNIKKQLDLQVMAPNGAP